MATPGGVVKVLTTEQKIAAFALWNETVQDESMYWFAKYWEERYKTAQLLPAKEWEEFKRTEAPRTLGDKDETYSAHYAHRALEYKAKKEAAMVKLRALIKEYCGEHAGMSQTQTGEVQCFVF